MKVLAINDIEYLQMSKIVYFIEAFCETLNMTKIMPYNARQATSKINSIGYTYTIHNINPKYKYVSI